MHTNCNEFKITVFFDTLGCAKNTVDSQKCIQNLIDNEICIVDNPQVADVIVINTCAFIQIAAQESIDTFFEYHKTYPDKKYIVMGCLVSRYAQDLKDELTEADYFLSCKEEHKLVNVVKNLITLPSHNNDYELSFHNKSFAYIKISEGCNKFCSYCTIPFIRGKYSSVEYNQIKKDILFQYKYNVKEIILVAQDCGVWGKDFEEKRDLTWLLYSLSKDFPTLKFRILYIQPDEVNDKLINAVASIPNIIKYLDIPIQHCNSNVLSDMNRNGNTQYFLDMFKKIKDRIPDVTIRTTLMVGFPGETKEAFNELCDFVSAANLDYIGIFPYSAEDGTKSALMNNQVSKSEKQYRLNFLGDLVDKLCTEKLDNRIGDAYDIIIEGWEDGMYYGRADFQCPDADGVIYLNTKNKLNLNTQCRTKITKTLFYDLEGELIE